MPSVEGESLRDRLTREKQFPITDAGRQRRGAVLYGGRGRVVYVENRLQELEAKVRTKQ
jgi:hypothetical protein